MQFNFPLIFILYFYKFVKIYKSTTAIVLIYLYLIPEGCVC